MVGKLVKPDVKKEGAGARVKRLFPSEGMKHYDPFVLLDEFFVEPDAGFPEHPHGGFEAVTYILDGGFRHKDNMGNDSAISVGGVQRFTAGKEIRHSEMPEGDGPAHGFQLWINLPKELKDIEPTYQKVSSDDIPVENKNGIKITKIIDDESPVKVKADMKYHDYYFEEELSENISIKKGFNSFIYVYNGIVIVDGREIKEGTGYFTEEKEISMSSDEDTRLIFLSGKPWNEEIKLQGSFVL
ncbi:MAG: pirin family protein [Thermoplasmatota archaeon]